MVSRLCDVLCYNFVLIHSSRIQQIQDLGCAFIRTFERLLRFLFRLRGAASVFEVWRPATAFGETSSLLGSLLPLQRALRLAASAPRSSDPEPFSAPEPHTLRKSSENDIYPLRLNPTPDTAHLPLPLPRPDFVASHVLQGERYMFDY